MMYTEKHVRSLLKKQKEICAKVYELELLYDENYLLVYNAILSAKEPEITEVASEYQTLKKGGSTNDVSEELHDIAWDIGIENGWLKNDKWQSDELKEKAFVLAKKEVSKYAKGGGTGISWIITG